MSLTIEERLQRVEGISAGNVEQICELTHTLAEFAQTVNQLAQVTLRATNRQETMMAAIERIAGAQAELAKAQRRADERIAEVGDKLDALIDIVDGIIKRSPPPPPPQ